MRPSTAIGSVLLLVAAVCGQQVATRPLGSAPLQLGPAFSETRSSTFPLALQTPPAALQPRQTPQAVSRDLPAPREPLPPVHAPASAKPSPARTGAGSAGSALTAEPGSVWDRLAACESGQNWADNTGNGYFGGLQMDTNFWASYGRDAADRPDHASREQQIAAAERARDGGRGYRPWPQCAAKLGLL